MRKTSSLPRFAGAIDGTACASAGAARSARAWRRLGMSGTSWILDSKDEIRRKLAMDA